VAVLTRRRLTAALAARQLLLERRRITAAQAVQRLTPLQAQHPPAPYLALAARLDGFAPARLERAIQSGRVVKTTIMRSTLHLAAAEDFPAYAQLVRQARLRTWRRTYAGLDEAQVTAELAAWLREPRTNAEIRERVGRYEGVGDDQWSPVMFARTLLALVQLPPAGFRSDRTRARFVVDPRPLPTPADAAAVVLARYLAAFGPAGLRDAAAWAGVAQRDLAPALETLTTVTYRDEAGTELLDLPRAPLPPASTQPPVRLLAPWDQPLLAYADRERIIPAELLPLGLTLSGDPTVTVDGRVAASWSLEREGATARITVTPQVELARGARAEIRAEAKRTLAVCEPDARPVEVTGV
jgi:Winged helix DNA-binding domain